MKRIRRYLMGTQGLGLWYPKDTFFVLLGYSDADFAGSRMDRKSTSGICQFLSSRLVLWFNKKRTSMALLTLNLNILLLGVVSHKDRKSVV